MDRPLIALIISFLILTPAARAAPKKPIAARPAPTGFQNISFGEEKDKTISLLEDAFEINPNFGASENGVGLQDFDKFAILSNFPLGERQYDVYFYFNKSGKFYSYEFRGEKKNANFIENTIKDDALYLSKVFEKKFGPPSIKNNPTILNIKQGYVTFFWKWTMKKHTVFTGLSTYENEYYASATVTDDVLEKEDKAFHKKKEAESIEDAAKGF
jgi:hypothetical protein